VTLAFPHPFSHYRVVIFPKPKILLEHPSISLVFVDPTFNELLMSLKKIDKRGFGLAHFSPGRQIVDENHTVVVALHIFPNVFHFFFEFVRPQQACGFVLLE